MTFAPQTLRDLAAYWTSQGGVNLGIVGDAAHGATGTSYHLGESQLIDGAYSAKLPRDVAGLSDAASAIDLGKLDGTLANLQAFSRWFVAWCKAGGTGAHDVREIIYSPDGFNVKRYDATTGQIYNGGTGTGQGDDSHRTHTHVSYWRDSEFRDKREPFRAYFAAPDTGTGDPDMGPIATYPRRTTVRQVTGINDGAYRRCFNVKGELYGIPTDVREVFCVVDIDPPFTAKSGDESVTFQGEMFQISGNEVTYAYPRDVDLVSEEAPPVAPPEEATSLAPGLYRVGG